MTGSRYHIQLTILWACVHSSYRPRCHLPLCNPAWQSSVPSESNHTATTASLFQYSREEWGHLLDVAERLVGLLGDLEGGVVPLEGLAGGSRLILA